MLESGVIVATIFVAAVQCGVVPTYQQAPLTTIAKISAPLPYAAPRLSYATASPLLPKYQAPVAYTAQAPVAYAAHAPAATLAYTSAKIAAPVAYASHATPVAYASHATPVAYAAHAPAVYSHAPTPVAYAAAPAYAKYAAAPVAYAAAPVAKAVVPHAIDTDYDPNPSYSYAYDVQDALTGDSKNQHESRQGDTVQGSYSLTEPDGTRRTVEYTADPVNGFNAVVHREPAVVQKAVVAAPAYASHAPIVAAHAPVGHYSYH